MRRSAASMALLIKIDKIIKYMVNTTDSQSKFLHVAQIKKKVERASTVYNTTLYLYIYYISKHYSAIDYTTLKKQTYNL